MIVKRYDSACFFTVPQGQLLSLPKEENPVEKTSKILAFSLIKKMQLTVYERIRIADTGQDLYRERDTNLEVLNPL